MQVKLDKWYKDIDDSWFVDNNFDPCTAVLRTKDNGVTKAVADFEGWELVRTDMEKMVNTKFGVVRTQYLLEADTDCGTPQKKTRDDVHPPGHSPGSSPAGASPSVLMDAVAADDDDD